MAWRWDVGRLGRGDDGLVPAAGSSGAGSSAGAASASGAAARRHTPLTLRNEHTLHKRGRLDDPSLERQGKPSKVYPAARAPRKQYTVRAFTRVQRVHTFLGGGSLSAATCAPPPHIPRPAFSVCNQHRLSTPWAHPACLLSMPSGGVYGEPPQTHERQGRRPAPPGE